MLTDDQLEAIKVRDRARTPGEWTWEDDSCLQSGMVTVYAGRTDGSHGLNLFGRLFPDAHGTANLDWLVACSVDVPLLVAEVDRLRTANAALTESVARLRAQLDDAPKAEY